MTDSNLRDDTPRTARLAVGALLVGLGLFLFLDRTEILRLDFVDHWWPFIVMAVGVAQLVSGGPRRKARSGVLLILLSLWFLVATHGWYGLGWRESWPLALIAVGGSQLLVPSRRRPPKSSPQAAKRRRRVPFQGGHGRRRFAEIIRKSAELS